MISASQAMGLLLSFGAKISTIRADSYRVRIAPPHLIGTSFIYTSTASVFRALKSNLAVSLEGLV